MKISFFGTPEDEQDYLKAKLGQALPDLVMSFSEAGVGPDALPDDKDADILGVFVDSAVNAQTIGAFPNLKAIVTLSTGYDHIDLAECAKRNITVCNVPSYGENTVAEFAFGLILSLSRKIYAAADQIKENGSFSLEGLRGFDLLGKTLGVVGTGHIGQHAIKIANGFGMNVIAYDPYPNEQAAKELGFKYVSLDELLANSDIVTLHVPYSKETHHLIDNTALSKMKKTALLINTSRGGIVDTEALVMALKDKKIAGAGLDVLEEENATKDEMAFINRSRGNEEAMRIVLEDHALMRMPNVIITPHNAFNTDEALKRILDTTIDNVKGFAEGKPVNVVKNK